MDTAYEAKLSERKEALKDFFGGYEGAERRQLHFLPDWAFGPEEDAVAALRCRFYEAGTLNHRDFLGSLMGLGLTREQLYQQCGSFLWRAGGSTCDSCPDLGK